MTGDKNLNMQMLGEFYPDLKEFEFQDKYVPLL